MRIAIISTLFQRVPPRTYGAVERIVHDLADVLVRRGHIVTLFASGDSITDAKLHSVAPMSFDDGNITGLKATMLIHLNTGKAFGMQDQFDVMHLHDGFFSLPAANIARTPCLVTVHSDFHDRNRQIYEQLKKPYLVSISRSHAERFSGLNHIGTVYNGLEMSHYPFSEEHDGYLLYVGRIARVKGIHKAIEVARLTNHKLIIAAKNEEQDYFNEEIKPHLSERVRYIGEVDEEKRNRLMSRAKAFIHATSWEEPFGLTLIEAMATGCPVIAIGRGAIPEIVADGKTGFVAKDIKGMAESLDKIGKIKRKDCRVHALKNFSAERMAEGYERLYREIMKKEY